MNSTFLTSETGAVTVDWVVLTAALVGLGLAVMGVVSQGVEDVSVDIDTQLRKGVVAYDWGSTAYDECSDPQIADCGTDFTPWITGEVTVGDHTYPINDDGVIVNFDNSDPMPITAWESPSYTDAQGNVIPGDSGYTDIAGRAVDENGVPLDV